MNKILEIDLLSDERKREILNSPDSLEISGRTFYVSSDGCDENDGLSRGSPWKTLEKVSCADLDSGDGVLFKRGDLFRGFVKAQSGVTYGAYGAGEKPKFYGWYKDLAKDGLWELFDHVWSAMILALTSLILSFFAWQPKSSAAR